MTFVAVLSFLNVLQTVIRARFLKIFMRKLARRRITLRSLLCIHVNLLHASFGVLTVTWLCYFHMFCAFARSQAGRFSCFILLVSGGLVRCCMTVFGLNIELGISFFKRLNRLKHLSGLALSILWFHISVLQLFKLSMII